MKNSFKVFPAQDHNMLKNSQQSLIRFYCRRLYYQGFKYIHIDVPILHIHIYEIKESYNISLPILYLVYILLVHD